MIGNITFHKVWILVPISHHFDASTASDDGKYTFHKVWILVPISRGVLRLISVGRCTALDADVVGGRGVWEVRKKEGAFSTVNV